MTAKAKRPIRCAIYTRKSTEEGLQQEFNTLDAQREAGEAFIRSQAHEGWVCLPTRYDDGGFSGGNLERPGLRRLLADIADGQVDLLVVYKIDRLSRSLLDFARLMEQFDQHQVAFVAVTQQMNSATSMGRLVLNVLLSFAQFERELIAERTRDKIAATRRKGKWAGGMPLLGYDVVHSKLVVNPDEADRVRAIFQLYREQGALLPVVRELARRGWCGKRWTTRKGHERGGRPFTTTSLHHLLTRVAYVGRVRYRQEHHPGEHSALIDAALWQEVQALLRRKGTGSLARTASQDLLRGLLRCGPCGCAMTPSYASKGPRRYRYYVCTLAQKRGRATCPSKSISATLIENAVWDQVRALVSEPERLRALAQDFPDEPDEAAPSDLKVADLATADWQQRPLAEQATLVQQLVRQIDYDGGDQSLRIQFRPAGIRGLVEANQ